MKIVQKCPVCGTECESYDVFDSLEAFYAFESEEPQFSHDEGNRDCGGNLIYSAGREVQKELVVVAHGGIRFHVSLVTEGDTRGNFLGSMEFGSLDADGQYEQDDDEIIDAAREQFSIDESIPAVVR